MDEDLSCPRCGTPCYKPEGWERACALACDCFEPSPEDIRMWEDDQRAWEHDRERQR